MCDDHKVVHNGCHTRASSTAAFRRRLHASMQEQISRGLRSSRMRARTSLLRSRSDGTSLLLPLAELPAMGGMGANNAQGASPVRSPPSNAMPPMGVGRTPVGPCVVTYAGQYRVHEPNPVEWMSTMSYQGNHLFALVTQLKRCAFARMPACLMIVASDGRGWAYACMHASSASQAFHGMPISQLEVAWIDMHTPELLVSLHDWLACTIGGSLS